MTAQIAFNDGAVHIGSYDGGLLTSIVVSNVDNTGVLGWSWELLDVPVGSAAVLSSATAAAPTFTADIRGTYFLRLTTHTDVGRTILDGFDEQVYAIRLAGAYNWRVPAAGEARELSTTRGWAIALDDIIRDINTFMTSGATALADAAPPAIAAAGAVGTSPDAAREDHTHAHGNLSNGPLHSVATSDFNGFMSTADKIKLDAIDLTDPLAISVATVSTPGITITELATGIIVGLAPFGIEATGPLLFRPSTAPTNTDGYGVTVQGGACGPNVSDTPVGGVLDLDGGSPNGVGTTGGNVKIGRTNAGEVLIGKEGGGAIITLEGTVEVIGGALDMNSNALTGLGTPTAATDAAHKAYVDQPAQRLVAGATDTIVAADIGSVVFYSNAAGVETELPDLSASMFSTRLAILTFQNEGAATVLTIDPGVGVTIDGATTSVVGAAGRKRVSLFSRDGLAWYSGA